MAIWFSIALLAIISSIPWQFSPLVADLILEVYEKIFQFQYRFFPISRLFGRHFTPHFSLYCHAYKVCFRQPISRKICWANAWYFVYPFCISRHKTQCRTGMAFHNNNMESAGGEFCAVRYFLY